MNGLVSSTRSTIASWWTVNPDVYTKFGAEFLGCMLFHLLGSLSPTAECNSVLLIILVFFTAKLSGGHLNPVISWVFNLLGYTNPLELLMYYIAQICGCLVGALWLSLLVPGVNINSNKNVPSDGCFTPDEDMSNSQIMGCEAFGTFTFVVAVFSVVWYTQNKQGYGTVGPIMIGLSLLGPAYAFGRLTGSALNPARALASYVVYGCDYRDNYVIPSYIGGEFLGAFLAVFVLIPWYGISVTAWYLSFINQRTLEVISKYQPSIEIRST